MKHFSLLLLVCVSLFLTGCQDATIKATTVEGVLVSVEDIDYQLNNISSWKTLIFQDGRKVMVHVGPGDSLFFGHYQEIDLNAQGMIVDVRCKSFEMMVKQDGYKNYDPTTLAEWQAQNLYVPIPTKPQVVSLTTTAELVDAE